jgi:hypothetical protein
MPDGWTKLETLTPAVTAWTERRRRAVELTDRCPWAAAQLGLYRALLEVQEPAFHDALDHVRSSGALTEVLPVYVADRILPRVVDVSVAHGPPPLAEAVLERRERSRGGDGAELIAAWLRDEAPDPVARYLARASGGPVLEALAQSSLPPPDPPDDGGEGRHGRTCPACGGLPQVAYLADGGEALVTAPRRLVCSRCHHVWAFARTACAGCGERSGAKRPIYGEAERLPHLRIDACLSCERYLVTVDLRKDPGAVPIVDELTALPLDLHAREQGQHKIVANLMGI